MSLVQTARSSPRHPHRPWDPRRALGRLALSTSCGLATFTLLPLRFDWSLRAVAAWDVAALLLCSIDWSIIWRAHAKATEERAAAEDPGRNVVWVLVLLSCVFSLFASVYVLRQVDRNTVWTALTLLSVLLAWVLTHTAYTLRYAHLYYHGGRGSGLEYPGGHPPADIDFAYFAFTIGICFQTSDVAISSSVIRRTVLLHAIVSFLYNTTILALALNFLFGVVGGGP